MVIIKSVMDNFRLTIGLINGEIKRYLVDILEAFANLAVNVYIYVWQLRSQVYTTMEVSVSSAT